MASDFIEDESAGSAEAPLLSEPFVPQHKISHYDIFGTMTGVWPSASAGADDSGPLLADSAAADTDDSGEWLLEQQVNIRAEKEKDEAIAAMRAAAMDAEYDELRMRLQPDAGHSIANEQTDTHEAGILLTAMQSVERSMANRPGAVAPFDADAPTILTFHQDADDRSIAGQLFQAGRILILILPVHRRAAVACRHILTDAAKGDRTWPCRRTVGKVTWWTVTYQEMFDDRFEVAPFATAVHPNSSLSVRILSPNARRFYDAPYLLRDRTTSCLTAWVREGHEEEDLETVRTALRVEWDRQEPSREYFRNESAWEIVQWLTTEEIKGEYNHEGRRILSDEVGTDRAEAMFAAARIIASLFDRFRPD